MLSRDCCRYFYHLDVIFFKKTTESFIMRKKDIIASTDAVGVVYESLAANKYPHGWPHGLLYLSQPVFTSAQYIPMLDRETPQVTSIWPMHGVASCTNIVWLSAAVALVSWILVSPVMHQIESILRIWGIWNLVRWSQIECYHRVHCDHWIAADSADAFSWRICVVAW